MMRVFFVGLGLLVLGVWLSKTTPAALLFAVVGLVAMGVVGILSEFK